MAVMPNLTLNHAKGTTDGFVDLAEFTALLPKAKQQQLAKRSLVFMLQNLKTKTIVPLCYYFSGNSVPAAVMEKMIVSIIQRLIEHSIDVRCTVCDASTSNQAVFSRLGVCIGDDG